MEWYNMTYDEIKKIKNLELKKKYLEKYRIGLIWFVNPLYDSLTKKEKALYDEFDALDEQPMINKIRKLKEIIGDDVAKTLVYKRIYRK